MTVTLIHPDTGQRIERAPEDAPTYAPQGWVVADDDASSVEQDTPHERVGDNQTIHQEG